MEENPTNQNRITEILNQLSYSQLRFITARLESDTDKEAALKIGIMPQTASGWPERELIKEALTLMAMRAAFGVRAILERNAIKAAMVKVKGLDSSDEKIAQQSAREVLEWIINLPDQTINVNDGLTDDQRIARLTAILNTARERGSRSADNIDQG